MAKRRFVPDFVRLGEYDVQSEIDCEEGVSERLFKKVPNCFHSTVIYSEFFWP